ncbi:SDR family NAD(P)-dependent oxidoreductase [Neisseria bacilliformis]|uniref:SDR family NAD(P)-dependent oxidoreductase n=1 Tax=Neisseria bacilliformis TaxID=267212 RepID=UPI0028EBE772|nr:SDR family NAD(P)-dependent oxidoreductase [Neisseria bacilliformis]
MDKLIITGHTRGLGRALAELYLRRGWRVLGLARGEAALRPSENLHQVSIDLADGAALAAWLSDTSSPHGGGGGGLLRDFLADAGKILLINNAAAVSPNAVSGRQRPSEILSAVSLNVAAPLLLANAVLAARPALVPLDILHIGSGAGRKSYAGWSVYGASKAALDHHARCLAAEHHENVRAACLAPGVVDTDMQAQIRASDAAAFPLKGRFVSLKNEGGLQTAADTAAKIAAYVESERFGTEAAADIRDFW